MALALIRFRYLNGEIVECSMTSTAEHPDAQDEAAARAVWMYREIVGADIDEDTGP